VAVGRVQSGVAVRVGRTVVVLTVELAQRLELVDERPVLTLEHHDAHLEARDVLLLLPPAHTSRLTARTAARHTPPIHRQTAAAAATTAACIHDVTGANATMGPEGPTTPNAATVFNQG